MPGVRMFVVSVLLFSGCLLGSSPPEPREPYDAPPAPPATGSGSSSGSTPVAPYAAPPTPTRESVPSACRPGPTAWSEVFRLHQDAHDSVHELITCGGLQTRVSQTLMTMIVASNRDLFTDETYAELVSFAEGYGIEIRNPFERGVDGTWRMPTSGRGGITSFGVVFAHPKTGRVIQDDPFVLESYVTGATTQSSLSFEQMRDDLFARNDIRFSWVKRGPLADLFNGGEPFDNPFLLSVSFADLAEYVFGFDVAEGDPDLGPIGGVRDLLLTSSVEYTDDRNGTQIAYDADGRQGTVDEIAHSGVGFDVRAIEALRGDYTLSGPAAQLNYERTGSLSGAITYRVSGPDADVVVTNDFGSGRAYPSITFACP